MVMMMMMIRIVMFFFKGADGQGERVESNKTKEERNFPGKKNFN